MASPINPFSPTLKSVVSEQILPALRFKKTPAKPSKVLEKTAGPSEQKNAIAKDSLPPRSKQPKSEGGHEKQMNSMMDQMFQQNLMTQRFTLKQGEMQSKTKMVEATAKEIKATGTSVSNLAS